MWIYFSILSQERRSRGGGLARVEGGWRARLPFEGVPTSLAPQTTFPSTTGLRLTRDELLPGKKSLDPNPKMQNVFINVCAYDFSFCISVVKFRVDYFSRISALH